MIRQKAKNPINKNDNKFFQYAVTVELNYEKIGKRLERILKMKPFLDKYNQKGINYPSKRDHW